MKIHMIKATLNTEKTFPQLITNILRNVKPHPFVESPTHEYTSFNGALWMKNYSLALTKGNLHLANPLDIYRIKNIALYPDVQKLVIAICCSCKDNKLNNK